MLCKIKLKLVEIFKNPQVTNQSKETSPLINSLNPDKEIEMDNVLKFGEDKIL